MDAIPDPLHAEHHLQVLFSARAARSGGVVRRSARWSDREIGRDRLVAEVKRRGFHMIECGGQYVIICHPAGLRVVC